MKILSVMGLLLALSACNRGIQNKDAVRQGVIDYLSSRPNLSMTGITVDVADVNFKDGKAEAEVKFTPKGGPPSGAMTMRYTLEQKENKWVVISKADSGQSPHGAGAVAPGMPNPHAGGGMVDTERPGGMPPAHPPAGESKPGAEKKK